MIEKRLHLVRGAAAKFHSLRAGEGKEGRGQGQKRAAAKRAAKRAAKPPTDTPTPDTLPTDTPTPPEPRRVAEGMKTECKRNAKGKKSRNASGMQGQCNRKSRMAAARGKGQKQPEPPTEPKAAKSLGAYTHERWRLHAETAKAMTFAAFWRGLAALGCLPLPLSRHLPAFSLACPCIRLHRLFPLCIRLHRIATPTPPCAALVVSVCRVAGCRVLGCRLAARLLAWRLAWRLRAALLKRASHFACIVLVKSVQFTHSHFINERHVAHSVTFAHSITIPIVGIHTIKAVSFFHSSCIVDVSFLSLPRVRVRVGAHVREVKVSYENDF